MTKQLPNNRIKFYKLEIFSKTQNKIDQKKVTKLP